MKRWVELLLLVALAALPLHRPAIHQAPNIGLGDLVAGLALAAYLMMLRLRLPRGSWLRLAVLVVTLAPAVLVAPDHRRALAQLAGLAYVMLLSGAAAALAGERRDDALRAFVIGAALACTAGFFVWQRYAWMPLPRPVGPTESPAMLSMVALAGLFALRALGGWRWLAALFWATLVAAQSRILLCAIIGVAVEAWPLVPIGTKMVPSGTTRRILIGTSAAVALALFVASLVWRIVPISQAPPFIDTNPTPYRVCHQVAWRAFADHPLTGVGLRGFHAAWPRYVDLDVAERAFAPLPVTPRDPHGTLQGYLAECGLPALVLLGTIAWQIWRRRGSTGYFVALVLASCTLDLLTERSTWALLGLMSAGYHWPRDESTKR